MHCPYCGKQITDSARVCGYCGRRIGTSTPSPSSHPPPSQPPPTQIIIQPSSSEGLFSSLAGLINFSLTAVALVLIAVLVLVFLCVIRLPSDFPVINLPSQLDDLWGRAVAWQSHSCSGAASPAPGYQPPVENPAPQQPKPDQPDPPVVVPDCNSDLGEDDCRAAGGNPTMMCDLKEGCHTICFCNK